MDKSTSLFEEAKTIAICGSLLTDQWSNEKQDLAKLACEQVGQELAKANWKLAVYTSHPAFIELYIIKGYINSGASKPKSIFCYYPRGIENNFPIATAAGAEYVTILDQSPDWQVSFFRSLTKIDAVLLLGGGTTTLTAGQLAIIRGVPLLSIAHFGGAAAQVWTNLKSEKNSVFDEDDIQVMAAPWGNESAIIGVKALNKQYEINLSNQASNQKAVEELNQKAQNWDNFLLKSADEKKKAISSSIFLFLFLLFFIAGLVIDTPGIIYPIVSVLSLCLAGGVGATVRMLTSDAPKSEKMAIPILGITVGLFFSLLYLLPQLIQNSGFLIPQKAVTTPLRVQFISSIVVAFLAGLAFDYSLDQLLSRAKNQNIIKSNSSSNQNEKNPV